MKTRHNKKRNTAFLFETLVRELTRATIRKDQAAKLKVTKILKEHFSSNSILGRELGLYRSLCETTGLSQNTAERMLSEAKEQHKSLDKEQIYTEQGEVIKRVNKDLSRGVFSTFVPSYKSLATVQQIFSADLTAGKKVLLEESILARMTSDRDALLPESQPQVDNLVIKNFIKKFNDKYAGTLFEEQSELLQNYILSFSDNALSLKSFLNEEISRLRVAVETGKQTKDFADDADMANKADKVLEFLNEFKKTKFSVDSLTKILKIQNLVKEMGE
jgi:hypothetical protein